MTHKDLENNWEKEFEKIFYTSVYPKRGPKLLKLFKDELTKKDEEISAALQAAVILKNLAEQERKEAYSKGYDQWFLEAQELKKGLIASFVERAKKELNKIEELQCYECNHSQVIKNEAITLLTKLADE